MSYNNNLDPAQITGGNITARVSNALPTVVMPVGGLFEISMPANTDVRIRALVARQVYILSEGEYPGGSFSTSTAAIVNLTTAFVPADNNVHVPGERNTITIQDVLSGRIFKVIVWRFGPIAGNWSGWVEEIGITTSNILSPTAPIAIANSVVSYTAPYIRAHGKITLGDLTTAVVVVPESTAGITATSAPLAGGAAIVTIVLPAGILPDALYKVMPVISSNPGEATASHASITCEILDGQTATTFRVALRENFSAVQNCNLNFIIIR